MTNVGPPLGAAALAVRSSSAFRRPASTTAHPVDCNASAAARPIPLPAPVTNAILATDSFQLGDLAALRKAFLRKELSALHPKLPVAYAELTLQTASGAVANQVGHLAQ